MKYRICSRWNDVMHHRYYIVERRYKFLGLTFWIKVWGAEFETEEDANRFITIKMRRE